jgi:hypothetical protein
MIFAPMMHSAYMQAPVACIVRQSLNRTATQAITGTDRIGQITVGPTKYYLKRTLFGNYDPSENSYLVAGFEHIGHGPTSQAARSDWETKFHVHFQEIYAKLAFEMSETERTEWESLQTIVDVYDYSNRTPITLRMVGQITSKRSGLHVCWIDGTTSVFEPSSAPAELAGLSLARWFEAVAKRDPRTGRFLSLDAIAPTLSPVTRARAASALKLLPDTSAYPDTEISDDLPGTMPHP